MFAGRASPCSWLVRNDSFQHEDTKHTTTRRKASTDRPPREAQTFPEIVSRGDDEARRIWESVKARRGFLRAALSLCRSYLRCARGTIRRFVTSRDLRGSLSPREIISRFCLLLARKPIRRGFSFASSCASYLRVEQDRSEQRLGGSPILPCSNPSAPASRPC